MHIFKKFFEYIKKILKKSQLIVKLKRKHNKDYILKSQERFLLNSIKQTLKEIPDFDYKKWKERYGKELFYFLFEQIFRGSSDTIKSWQKVYVEYIKDAYNTNRDKVWLDIGCGRGEFISLLKEENIPYLGLDINSVNVDLCKSKDLNVVKKDALEYLEEISDNSLCGISALQVVEHFDRDKIERFLNLCYNKISPLGKLIIETVNIKNKVALKNYFNDPTHNLPIMPEFLEMFLEFIGFREVFILYLRHSFCLEPTEISNYPDYAVVATK